MSVGRAGLVLGLVVLLGVCLCACQAISYPTDHDARVATIYLVSHGWHAGLVIRRRDIPEGLWPEHADFPEADYLEVGFGDRDYYQAHDPGLWLAFKAAVWPSAGVLQVVGVRSTVIAYFPHSEIVELPMTRADLHRLIAYVHDSHERKGQAKATSLGHGLYGDSRFYPARIRFHLFNTCNVWVANALRCAGYPVVPLRSITTGGLLAQVRTLSRSVQAAPFSR